MGFDDDDVADDFMGGGAKSFPFDNPGDTVTGKILSIKKRQQTDMKTGEPKVWANGDPRWMYTITLQTDLREDEFDDGQRTINVKWKSQRAVQDAVRAAGGKKPEIGGLLSLKYVRDGAAERGQVPPKEWAAMYRLPEINQADEFMSGPPAPAPSRQPEQRMADHHGNPQGEPPAWAQPPQGSVGARPGSSTLDSMRSAPQGSAGERDQFGF
jgi:hypothetical protein